MNEQSTVIIVDDDRAVRDALTFMLAQQKFAVRTFDSATAFLAGCKSLPRSCAIVDIRMPGMDGMELQSELSKRGIALPLIFLTGHGDIQMSVRAMKAGAVDFLTKPVSRAALLQSVQAALAECDRQASRARVNKKLTAAVGCLTEREREVMLLLARGLTNKEVARRLQISHRTVEVHKARVMRKTGAESLVELADIAKATGMRD